MNDDERDFWHRHFDASVHDGDGVRVTKTSGNNWTRIEMLHPVDGTVMDSITLRSQAMVSHLRYLLDRLDT